ncbi:MAG: mechanosensitive ion channel family protein [Lentisphaeria bacterium]|nr:mechanosensitive ion channel family protein [Lentisphaeria bacterium]
MAANANVNVNDAFSAVREGNAGEFFQSLWEQYQDEIINLGRCLLLTILVILLAWLVAKITRRMLIKAMGKIPGLDESVGKILAGIAKTVTWLFAALIILDLFGINTASILTVLGAAGLAVGLAMKDSLSNIASGLMLLFLRPYKSGDYVDCGSVSGTIKEIGLFTTILMTVDGVYISAPNSAIFGHPIKNFSRNPLRRADITVGIAYGDSLSCAVETLKKLMLDSDLIMKEPAPEVLVAELADSSVNLTLRFWTATENYWAAYWMIKAQLKTAIESAGLNIPFPQRVVTFANAIPEKKAE